ncbi:unnamed protein product [Lampetra fluviatilis]
MTVMNTEPRLQPRCQEGPCRCCYVEVLSRFMTSCVYDSRGSEVSSSSCLHRLLMPTLIFSTTTRGPVSACESLYRDSAGPRGWRCALRKSNANLGDEAATVEGELLVARLLLLLLVDWRDQSWC